MLDTPRTFRSLGARIPRGGFVSLLSLLLLTACGDSSDERPGIGGPAAPTQAPAPAASPDSAISGGVDWSHDQRLRGLITTCPGKGRFNRDTSEMLPVLVEKLIASQQSVLRHVREELALIGEPALVELDRLVRRSYSDRHASHTIVNALGVFRMSDDGGGATAMDLYRICLGHPQETIRMAAVRALTDHPGPELFEEIRAQLNLVQGPPRLEVLEAMRLSNPERTVDLAYQFLESGGDTDLHHAAARIIANECTAESAARSVPLLMQVTSPPILAFLTASLTRLPNQEGESLGLLEEMLKSEEVGSRADALEAIMTTDRIDWVVRVLREDPHPELRGRALGFLAEQPETPEILAAILDATNTEDRKLQESALKVLLGKGHPAAADMALELWGGGIRDLEIATRAVQGNWEQYPDLAERAFKVLKARYEGRADAELHKREAWIQAISQIPGPESTRFLLERASSESGVVKGHSAHSFFTLEASNTGPAGYVLLREAWWKEEDTERRFSLAWAGSLAHDEPTRDFLIELIQAERSLPHERLWAAERLAQEGPASLVAPIIKRANLRVSHPVFRPAMECLLWRWYG